MRKLLAIVAALAVCWHTLVGSMCCSAHHGHAAESHAGHACHASGQQHAEHGHALAAQHAQQIVEAHCEHGDLSPLLCAPPVAPCNHGSDCSCQGRCSLAASTLQSRAVLETSAWQGPLFVAELCHAADASGSPRGATIDRADSSLPLGCALRRHLALGVLLI